MKRWYLFPIILIGIILIAITIFISPLSKNFLETYVLKKLCMSDKFKLEQFNHSFNSFSMNLKNGNNSLEILGNLYPFSATYTAKFNNLNLIFPDLQGRLNSTGEIVYKNHKTFINGNILFLNGYGKLKLNCINHKLKGVITLNKIDTNQFLSLIDENNFFKNISFKGENNLKFSIDENFKIKSNFNGDVIVRNFQIPLKIDLFAKLNSVHQYKFKSYLDSDDIKGEISGNKNKHTLRLKAHLSLLNLSFFKEILLYPFEIKIPIDINYETNAKSIFFASNIFSGEYKKNEINIQINSKSEKFFKLLNLKNIILAKNVSGNIYINRQKKQGSFDLVFSNAKFSSLNIIKKIEKIAGINIEKSNGTFLVNGKFDNKKIVFNAISKDQNYMLIIKNGVYDYDKKTFLYVTISSKTKTVLLKISNNVVKLIKVNYIKTPIKTLVY